MTASIKEVLERCRNYIASPLRMSNDDDEKKRRDDIVMCADQALASLESGDARERIARIIHPVGFEENSMERVEVVAAYQKEALAKADAILATGLVPGEASRHLSNLLAIIHRDGGHHQAKHGTEKAIADAHLKWADLISRAEQPDESATRADERERCALVVERWSLPTIQTPSMWLIDKAGIAAAIRAGRGE